MTSEPLDLPLVPRGAAGPGSVPAGLSVDVLPSGIHIVRVGELNRLNTEYDYQTEMLSTQLIASDIYRSTRVTSGQLIETPEGGRHEVAGSLSDQWLVVPMVPETPEGTLTKAEAAAIREVLSPRGAPGLVLIDARGPGVGMVMTREGMASLGSIMTIAGASGDMRATSANQFAYPSSEFDTEAQAGERMLALRTSTEFSTSPPGNFRPGLPFSGMDSPQAGPSFPLAFISRNASGQVIEFPPSFGLVSPTGGSGSLREQIKDALSRLGVGGQGSASEFIQAYGALVPYDWVRQEVWDGVVDEDHRFIMWTPEVNVPIVLLLGDDSGGLPGEGGVGEGGVGEKKKKKKPPGGGGGAPPPPGGEPPPLIPQGFGPGGFGPDGKPLPPVQLGSEPITQPPQPPQPPGDDPRPPGGIGGPGITLQPADLLPPRPHSEPIPLPPGPGADGKDETTGAGSDQARGATGGTAGGVTDAAAGGGYQPADDDDSGGGTSADGHLTEFGTDPQEDGPVDGLPAWPDGTGAGFDVGDDSSEACPGAGDATGRLIGGDEQFSSAQAAAIQ